MQFSYYIRIIITPFGNGITTTLLYIPIYEKIIIKLDISLFLLNILLSICSVRRSTFGWRAHFLLYERLESTMHLNYITLLSEISSNRNRKTSTSNTLNGIVKLFYVLIVDSSQLAALLTIDLLIVLL